MSNFGVTQCSGIYCTTIKCVTILWILQFELTVYIFGASLKNIWHCGVIQGNFSIWSEMGFRIYMGVSSGTYLRNVIWKWRYNAVHQFHSVKSSLSICTVTTKTPLLLELLIKMNCILSQIFHYLCSWYQSWKSRTHYWKQKRRSWTAASMTRQRK